MVRLWNMTRVTFHQKAFWNCGLSLLSPLSRSPFIFKALGHYFRPHWFPVTALFTLQRILYHPISWPFHSPQDPWSLYSIQNCGPSSLFPSPSLSVSLSLSLSNIFSLLKSFFPLTLIMFSFPGPLPPYSSFLSFLFAESSFSFSIFFTLLQ